MKATLKTVSNLIAERKPFTCNKSLYGEQRGDTYIVFSYGEHFPLALCRDNLWFVNSSKYSPTTSRHQSKVRLGLHGIEYRELSVNEIRNLI